MASVTVAEFRAGRGEKTATNGHRPARTPILVGVARWAGRSLPSLGRARTAVMQWSAGALVTWAAFVTDPRLGAVAGAASLLVLEALGGAEAPQ